MERPAISPLQHEQDVAAAAAKEDIIHAAIEDVALRSRGKLVAYLATRFRDIAAAEDAVSDAFISALATWPETGCPANPEAWLLTTARRKLIDRFRRESRESSEDVEGLACNASLTPEKNLPDRRLALLFACTHPAIDPTSRAPLMLQVVLGLEASQVASAFLISPAAMAQRLVRAKTKIRDAGIPMIVPERSELPQRLEAVLDSIYACFSEGWADPTRTDTTRRDLGEEAIFLGRLVAELLPDEPEARGLLALMLYTEARRAARRSADGDYIPLAQQDVRLWNKEMIREAEAALKYASRAGVIGRYQLEAAIQSAHCAGVRTGDTPWDTILILYDKLVQLTGSPVASMNRALAVAELEGPTAGLAALDAVSGDKRLVAYQPYWAIRAHLLGRATLTAEARQAYTIAIGLERDEAIRAYLSRLSDELAES